MADYSDNCPTPKGILVIIEGKEEKSLITDTDDDDAEKGMEILETFIKKINKADPVIEVITSASSEADESFVDYKNTFNRFKINNVKHIHHATRREVMDDDLSDRVNEADAFFFTGGDQLLLTSLYGGSKFLVRLKERYIHEEIVVAGTSAGAMAMSTPMIYAGSKENQQIVGEVKITTGLEFLKDVCIDTHFVDRSRFIRMAQVIATNPTCIGLGIEEDTAIVVTDGLKVEVIGSGLITVIEGNGIQETNIIKFSEDKSVNIMNLRVHLLGKGNTYTLLKLNPQHQ